MNIKPKSSKTLVTAPGSPEAVFTQMIAGCEALWRETHLESLVTRTIKLLCSNFNIPAFALLRLQVHLEESGLEVVPLSMNAEDEFAGPILNEIIAQLRQIDLKSYDYADGINHLEVHDRGINFALLGDPQHDWYGLIWEDLPALRIAPSEIPTAQVSAEIAVDFLVKQLQTTCRWFSRFTETQTLLHIDDLTGLYNHRYLELSLEREIKRAQRYNSAFCLLFIDLDDFKPVNDQFGHLAGSQVLRDVAQILKQTVRDVDLVFRYGGDEFVVLLIESDSKAGYKTALRIRDRIEQTHFEVQPGRTAQLTSSIGVAAFPEHGLEKDRLLAVADECMYESKRNGKNRVVLVGSSPTAVTPAATEASETWQEK